MKKYVLLALAILFMACDKNTVEAPELGVEPESSVEPQSNDEPNSSAEPNSGGIYLDDICAVPLGSTFMGGGVANPLEGTSHRCHIYEKYFEEGPRWNEVASVVTITGFRHTGVTYSEPGQFIDLISINGAVLKADTSLDIPLEQGKYKGGCDQVSSVKITNYDSGTVKDRVTGEKNNDGKIDIEISLKDGRTLRIHYLGKIPYDGYF